MKTLFSSKLILTIFLLSIAYWLYLAFSTTMVISCDAIVYEQLGKLIHDHGFLPTYVQNGPQREPIYPLIIAFAMHLEGILHITYTKIMAFFGVLILLLTQYLMYVLLKQLNIRRGICALILGYLAISPALTNTAFSLFSEISTYPLILGIVLTSSTAWQALKQNNIKSILKWAVILGALFAITTFSKGIFEYICPFYIIIFLLATFFNSPSPQKPTKYLSFLLTTLFVFYVPVTEYKWLNQHYSGIFAVTNRGSWTLYGNTARRTEPLTTKKLLVDLAYTPGEGVCNNLFGPQECYFGSFQAADKLGVKKLKELTIQYPDHQDKVNKILAQSSLQLILKNPGQYTLLTIIEDLRMFFWESTKIGFVNYPPWLSKIYDIKLINNPLRLVMALMSLIAVFWIWQQCLFKPQPPTLLAIGTLIFLFIFFHSFFCILTRYALPIAPLYLIAIGYSLHMFLPKNKIDPSS